MYLICLFDQYYLRINQTNWDEIYNPNFATSFKTKKEANDWIKKNTTLAEYAVTVASKEAIEKYNEWMKTGGVRRTFDFVNNALSRKYKNDSAEEVLNWWLSVVPDSIRYEDYATWPDLYQKFDNLHNVERYHNEDYTETYLSVQLIFRKTSNLETFKKELNLVLPSVTQINDNYKLFSVFDRFLSAGGNSVILHYKSDTDCKVCGRWRSYIEGSLKECFDYLVKERYYGEEEDDASD